MSRTDKLRVVAILAVAYAVFLYYAYPGFLSIDSGQQLLESRSHVYSDWHPPAMAWLWGICERVVRGPLLMLLLQSTTFLAGIFMILRRALTPMWAAVFASAIFLLPPVVAPMAVIWKDSQMAGYLMLGFALLFRESHRARVIGLSLMLLACAMRHNGPGAVLPLLFVLDWGARRLARVAIIAAAFIVIAAGANMLNTHLTDKKAYQWHVSIAPYDIAGIMHFGRFFSDQEMTRTLDGTPLAHPDHIAYRARTTGYSTRTWWDTLNGEGRVFDWPENDRHRAALVRAWKAMVRANPLVYLRHRVAVFRSTLGLDGEPLFAPVWYNDPPDDYVKAANLDRVTPHQTAIGDAFLWIATHTIWFYPWLYLALALLFLPLARRQLDVLALYLSGIVYELTLLPFSTADVRYSHWLMSTLLVGTVMLVRRRVKTRAEPGP